LVVAQFDKNDSSAAEAAIGYKIPAARLKRVDESSCRPSEVCVIASLSPFRACFSFRLITRGLRPGLHSCAAPRLTWHRRIVLGLTPDLRPGLSYAALTGWGVMIRSVSFSDGAVTHVLVMFVCAERASRSFRKHVFVLAVADDQHSFAAAISDHEFESLSAGIDSDQGD
jgi:hypothetical protein